MPGLKSYPVSLYDKKQAGAAEAPRAAVVVEVYEVRDVANAAEAAAAADAAAGKEAAATPRKSRQPHTMTWTQIGTGVVALPPDAQPDTSVTIQAPLNGTPGTTAAKTAPGIRAGEVGVFEATCRICSWQNAKPVFTPKVATATVVKPATGQVLSARALNGGMAAFIGQPGSARGSLPTNIVQVEWEAVDTSAAGGGRGLTPPMDMTESDTSRRGTTFNDTADYHHAHGRGLSAGIGNAVGGSVGGPSGGLGTIEGILADGGSVGGGGGGGGSEDRVARLSDELLNKHALLEKAVMDIERHSEALRSCGEEIVNLRRSKQAVEAERDGMVSKLKGLKDIEAADIRGVSRLIGGEALNANAPQDQVVRQLQILKKMCVGREATIATIATTPTTTITPTPTATTPIPTNSLAPPPPPGTTGNRPSSTT